MYNSCNLGINVGLLKKEKRNKEKREYKKGREEKGKKTKKDNEYISTQGRETWIWDYHIIQCNYTPSN